MHSTNGNGHTAQVGNGTGVPAATARTNGSPSAESNQGKLIVLTAPLTESIDHAGYFIQMAMASLPIWLEWILNRKYPEWRNVEYNDDGSASYMPAGVGVLEKALLREFTADDIAVCYPDDLERFVGPETRVVAVSTHNPLGVTFAAGVYTSIFGSSKMPINSHYARLMFEKIRTNPHRKNFTVIVGGSGGWQITQTNLFEELSVDCVVDGRAESADTMKLFHRAIAGEKLDREVTVNHPKIREAILFPNRRTSFGVVEMTTGCGRRCNFCVPDLNPQLDLPKDKIMDAVRRNVEQGNSQISLATEDMFIWGQVGTGTPFFFPNREALVDLYKDSSSIPGVEQFGLSHSTIAPAVVDPIMIRQLSEAVLDKSPIHLPTVSRHPKKKALTPLIGLETGSIRLARQIMPGKGVPFPIEEWPSVVLEGLRIMNENNWYPMMTLIVGNPGETDDDVKATLDLTYEMERRGLFAFLVPSVFTPLHDTRMEHAEGVTETQNLSPLQWQLIMKCWKNNLRPGQYSWWGPSAWRIGSLVMWLTKLRRTNGRNFTWPLFMFASLMPEEWMERMGKIYVGKPFRTKNRKELLATIRPNYWKHLREDCGDLPDGWPGPSAEKSDATVLATGT
jgi:radical SAM superfamily enzyme YgiQ (UPF0313 family)